MLDREKVIKGLEICKNPHGRCSECPYDDGEINLTNCTSILCGDALALLKEQEAVEPLKQTEQTEWTVCDNCHKHIISKWTFCPHCGRSVKWDA